MMDKMKRSQAAFDKFSEDFCAKRREVRGPSTWKPKAGVKMPDDGRISHAEAKKLMPPGSRLCQTKGLAWHSRVPPLKETCRTWSKHGQEGALLIVVREAWRHYCFQEGIELKDCPMPGLFPGTA